MSKLRTFMNLGVFSFLFISAAPLAANVDPTRPFGQGSSSTEIINGKKLVLESIIHGDGIHTVVINGKVLKVGETIGEHRLVAVNDNSVVLRTATERLKLYVFKSKVFKEK